MGHTCGAASSASLVQLALEGETFPTACIAAWFSRACAGGPQSTLPGHAQILSNCFCLHLG